MADGTKKNQSSNSSLGVGIGKSGAQITGGFGFDLGKLLEDTTSATTKKITATQELNRVRTAETARIADSAQQLASKASESLGELDRITQGKVEARRLASSDSLVDRLTLMGEQILNPSMYTRQGRSQRTAEISQELAVRGQAHGLVAAGSQAKIALAESQALSAESEVLMQMEQIRASNVVMQAARENIENQQLLRQQYLLEKTPQELSTIMGLPTGKDGRIEIDGLKFTPTEIRERHKQLQMRESLSLLAPEVSNPEYAQRMNAYHSTLLQTMNLSELRELRKNNGILAAGPAQGQMVDAGVLDTFITRAQQVEADEFLAEQNKFTASNVMGMTVERAGATINKLDSVTPATSPLRMPLDGLRSEAAMLAKASMNPELTDAQQVMALTRYAEAEKRFYDAANKEAVRQAGSDKDLQGILFSQLTGQDPDPVMYEEVISNRLATNKPIGNVMKPEQSRRLAVLYQEQVAAHMAQGMTADSLLGEAPDRKELRQQMARRAVQRLAEETVEQETVKFQTQAVRIEGHPMHGLIPAQMQSIMDTADNAAWETTARRYGLSAEQLRQLKRGESLPQQPMDEIRAFHSAEAFQQEFYAYEKMQPGLGTAVANWYAGNAGEMLERQIQQLDPSLRTLVSPYVTNAAQELTSGWSNAKNSIALESARNTANYLTSSRDTYFNNALVLQMDSSLNEKQRKMLINELINPMIQQAKSAGLDEAKITEYVESQLQQVKPESAELRAALRSHLANRTMIQSNFEMLSDELVLNHERKMRYLLRAGPESWGILPGGIQEQLDKKYNELLYSSTLKWAYPNANSESPRR